jgi:hypothetical protein
MLHMKAKAKLITSRSTANEPEVKAPNLGFESNIVFEDKDGNKYFVPENTDYILHLGGRRSPVDRSFLYFARIGDIYDIEFEVFSGDRIVTQIFPMKVSLKPEDKRKVIIQATIIEMRTAPIAETKILTANVGLECDVVLEDEDKNKYYLLQPSAYALKLNIKKSPKEATFLRQAHKGFTCKIEIEYEEYSGDRIITDLTEIK